jgi:hypothetical protein
VTRALRPPVVVYAEPDVERTRGLHRAWEGHQARIAVAAPYGPHEHLPAQVLDALGKDISLSSGRVHGQNGTNLAAAWITAIGITDILLTGAERLSLEEVRGWVRWLAGFGVRSWLLFATSTPRRPEPSLAAAFEMLADDWGAERQPESRLLRHWPTAPAGARRTGTSHAPEHPFVPRVQGPMFIPTCQSILAPDAFDDIERRFDALVETIRSDVAPIEGRNANDRVCAVIRRHLDATRSTDEGVLVAVAAQVAALVPAGWHVSVNLQRLTAALEVLPRTGRADAEGWWQRLLAYRDPLVGTVAALYMADVDIIDQTHLTLGGVSVASNGRVSVCRPSGGKVILGEEQGIFLRAQLAFRQLHGVDSDGMLLRTHRADAASRRHLRHTLHVPMAEVGVNASDVPVRNERMTNPIWLDRYGITVTKLERAPQTRRKSRTKAAS